MWPTEVAADVPPNMVSIQARRKAICNLYRLTLYMMKWETPNVMQCEDTCFS